MPPSVLPLPDAEPQDEAVLPLMRPQASTSTSEKAKQKPAWRGADNVTWDPNPSAVRFVPPPLYEPLQSRLISPD
jgi:hypothetical protein